MSLVPVYSPYSASANFFEDITAASLTSNLKLCLDAGAAASYTSGQKWLDLSGGGYDFFLGVDGSVASDDPTFNGVAGSLTSDEYFSTDGGDHFEYDSTIETWQDNLAKDGAQFSMIFWLYFLTGGTNDLYWATVNTSLGRTGSQVRLSEAGNKNMLHWRVDNGGSTVIGFIPETGLTTAAWNMWGVTIDEPTGSGGGFYYLNGSYNQVSSADTFDATYSSPPSSSGDHPVILAGNGLDQPVAANTRIAGLMIWEGGVLSKANMDTIFAAQRGRFGL